jgi:hypothetical protein
MFSGDGMFGWDHPLIRRYKKCPHCGDAYPNNTQHRCLTDKLERDLEAIESGKFDWDAELDKLNKK